MIKYSRYFLGVPDVSERDTGKYGQDTLISCRKEVHESTVH